MTDDFATAMRRALEHTRAGDPAQATALIQEALSGRTGQTASSDAPTGPRLDARTRAPRTETPRDGTRIARRRVTCAAGSRDYRLFVPDGTPRGLIVMLHGCTQSVDDFARGTGMDARAAKAGFLVAYPAQTGRHNAQSCWNWFRPEDQRRGGGEPAIMAALAAELAAEFALPKGRTFAAGLSAGGAMAAILGEVYGDVFAAVGIHSGLPAGSARDVPSAFAAMQNGGPAQPPRGAPRIVFHGLSDTTVAPVNGARLVPGDGIETQHTAAGRRWRVLVAADGSELWQVEGAGHAWFGGDPSGSYADPKGPDASAEMIRYFTAAMEGTR